MVLTVFFVCLLSSCTDEVIPSGREKIEDEAHLFVNTNEEELNKNEMFSPEYIKLSSKLSDSHVSSNELIKILKQVTQVIFGESRKDSQIYESALFKGYFQLYADLYEVWQHRPEQVDFQIDYNQSLKRFKEIYLSPCISGKKEACEFVEVILKDISSMALVIQHIALQETNLNHRWDLLAIAFEVSGNYKPNSLKENYLITSIEVLVRDSKQGQLQNIKSNENRLKISLDLLSTLDWSKFTPKKLDLFQSLEVWKLDSKKLTWINSFRAQLIEHLPVYMSNSSDVLSAVSLSSSKMLDEKLNNHYDLRSYPAYLNADLHTLKNSSFILNYVLFGLLEGQITAAQGDKIYKQLGDQRPPMTEVFSLCKRIIRWVIAQKSIKSSKYLSEKLSEFPVSDRASVNKLITLSENLSPDWSYLFSNVVPAFSTFLGKNQVLAQGYSAQEVSSFFASLERNILRVSVFPNMLAVMYKMLDYEWADKSPALEVKHFYSNPYEMLDRFMTGNTINPWFNFSQVSLKFFDTESKQEQRNLLRYEVFESFYYFFATKMHQDYDINPGDILEKIFTKLLTGITPTLELLINKQSQIYFSNSGAIMNKFIHWCKGISGKETKKPEVLDYFQLFRYLTPYTQDLFFDSSSFRAVFGDKYESLDDLSKGVRQNYVTEGLDIFRQEYIPILETYKQILKMAQRLQKAHSRSLITDLSFAQEHLDKLENFRKVYLGLQLSVVKKYDDCHFTAAEESRRRARQITAYEKLYLEQIVHPLLALVSEQKMSLSVANKILAEQNDNHILFSDVITTNRKGEAQYVQTFQSFMYRAALYLSKGMKLKPVQNLAHHKWGYGEPIHLNAIVENLTIIIDGLEELLLTSTNKYILNGSKSHKKETWVYSDSVLPYKFASTMLSKITDTFSGQASTQRDQHTKWASEEVDNYISNNLENIEFYVQFYQLGEMDYINFTNKNCLGFLEKAYAMAPADCNNTHKPSLDPIVKTLQKMFEGLHLTKEKLDYFNTVDHIGYIRRRSLKVELNFNPAAIKNLDFGAVEYDGIAGYFDTAYDMFRADYLSNSYKSRSDVEVSEARGEGCARIFSLCLWLSEREMARELYYSRVDSLGLIFNMDPQFLTDQYSFVKNNVHLKYKALNEIEYNGQSYLDHLLSPEDLQVQVAREGSLEDIYPLSQRLKETTARYSKFFIDETGRFFLEDQDWSTYLKHSK